MDIKIVFSNIGKIENTSIKPIDRAKSHHVTFKIRL